MWSLCMPAAWWKRVRHRRSSKIPCHPYTIGLMASKPVVGKQVDELYSIPGKVPNPINMPNYCYFKDRCEMCVEGCEGAYPHEISISPDPQGELLSLLREQ